MPAPKNNLQEVLRKTSEPTPSAYPPDTMSASSKKFKPAPVVSARPANVSNFPSFSTPGFRRGAIPPRAEATLSSFDVVDVSSDSSPGRSVKRTSSDPSVASDPSPQAYKRLKNVVAEKENLYKSVPKPKGNTKDAPLQASRIRAPPKDNDDDDEPWHHMELDTERNPFAKLDRDFPAFAVRQQQSTYKQATFTSKQTDSSPKQQALPSANNAINERQLLLPEQDQDLLAMDTETLNAFNLNNHVLSKFMSDRELDYHRGITKDTDIKLVQMIGSIINARLEAIQKIKAYRDVEKSVSKSDPPLQVQSTELDTSVPSFDQPQPISATLPTTLPPHDNSRFDHSRFQDALHSPMPEPLVKGNQHVDDDDDDEPIPGSEADYWAGVDDVPLDIDGSFSDPFPSVSIAETPTPSAFTPPSDLTFSPYYSEITSKLKSVFGLKSFRHNQLEAITETLRGRDVFVLMPTGGGKSLCYQLPAVCQGGKTRGVTVVVSPLLALMKDQVHSLQEKNINVFLWNSEATYDDANTRMLGRTKPSLVYITPEKLKDNNQANRILADIYREKCLARFVIDEAHCISTWGQDFREAYQFLGALRDQFPDVPIMALTATARKVTVADITQRLKLRDHVFLTQSFNRPNLKYVIQPKTKKWMESMMDFIKTKHPRKSGVIYCLSRDKCEEVSRKLNENGFNARHFHAGMSLADKDRTLEEWRTDKVHIIVATIAFGMGIDKADVRFVIHYSLPKSLDGYYQETGRAGRDGKPADCILYFLHKDFYAIKNMIERPDANNVAPTKETIERQTAAARAVVDYCTGSECRRVELLHYFDEKFDKAQCLKGCDNCDNPVPLSSRDVSKEAKDAVKLIKSLQDRTELVTLAQSRDVLRGANTALMRNKGYDKEALFGCTRDLTIDLVDSLLRKLCMMDVLVEQSIQLASGFHSEYLKLGPGAQDFLRNDDKIIIQWHPKAGKVAKQPSAKPPSKRNKGKQKAIDVDPIELYEDDSSYLISDDDEEVIVTDPIIPSKKQAPPSRSTSDRRREVVEEIDLSEVAANLSTRTAEQHSNPGDLYIQMCDLRVQIMRRQRISDPDAIFSDQTLQYLSATCPQDYKTFTALVADDISDEQEASDRFKLYGAPFLSLCIQHRVASKATQPGLNIDNVRSRYEFQAPGSTSSAPASARTSKFKPHR